MRISTVILGLCFAHLAAASAPATVFVAASNSTTDSVSPAYTDNCLWWRRLFHETPRYRHRPSNGTAPNSSITGGPILPSDNSSCVNSAEYRGCWDENFNINTDPYYVWPDTGVTRTYSLDITNTTIAPDGVERQGFLIDGQYPGPTIYADWGDWVEVTVISQLEDNGTTMHFHGIRQWYTGAEDGTPGVTQCPIAPNQTAVYRWQATRYGTAWYHSHFAVQYGDGILGTIVVNGPSTANYDEDLGPYPFTDWYYETASARAYIISHTNGPPPDTADTGLINGTMVNNDGTGSYAVTTITQGKRYRLRLLNTAVDNSFAVSLDDHPFIVISADMTPIEPYQTDWLFVAIGQRYDVIIDANQKVGNYWFRAEAQSQPNPPCGQNANNGNIKSIFRYEGTPAKDPTSEATSYQQRCTDEVVVPYYNTSLPMEELVAGDELQSNIQIGQNAQNQTVVHWALDKVPLFVNWSMPTLESALAGETTFLTESDVLTLPNEGQHIYWLIQGVPGDPITISIPHPIHLHGHDFLVLGSGPGNLTAENIDLNYINPIRRDTAMLPGGGWLVVAFQVDNPGVWLMHCHLAWHSDEGMGVQFLEMEDHLNEIASPATSFGEVCGAWDEYYPEYAAYPRGDDSGI